MNNVLVSSPTGQASDIAGTIPDLMTGKTDVAGTGPYNGTAVGLDSNINVPDRCKWRG